MKTLVFVSLNQLSLANQTQLPKHRIPETYMMREEGRPNGASVQRRNSVKRGGGNEAPFASGGET